MTTSMFLIEMLNLAKHIGGVNPTRYVLLGFILLMEKYQKRLIITLMALYHIDIIAIAIVQ